MCNGRQVGHMVLRFPPSLAGIVFALPARRLVGPVGEGWEGLAFPR